LQHIEANLKDNNSTGNTEAIGRDTEEFKEELSRKRKTIIVIKATKVARDTTDCRSRSVIPCVMVKNTGMVPRGFVNVKKEVKQSKAKGKIVSIAV